MIAAVYIPLWVPAAVLCVLCLLPGLPADVRRAIVFVRSLAVRRRRRRLLAQLWADEVGVGRGVAVPSTRGPVATTTAADTDGFFLGDAA